MPKGRVIALFALLRADAETIALVLHDADPAQFAAQLQRFVFRSKVAIETGELEVGGAFEAHPAANGTRAAMAPDGFAFDFSGDGGARTLWAGPGLASVDDLDARARGAAFDLAPGLPRLAGLQYGEWTDRKNDVGGKGGEI